MKCGSDVDPDLLISTATKIEEISSEPSANKKLIKDKSLSLLHYIDTHAELLDISSKLKVTLETCCWVVPKASPPPCESVL